MLLNLHLRQPHFLYMMFIFTNTTYKPIVYGGLYELYIAWAATEPGRLRHCIRIGLPRQCRFVAVASADLQ